MSYYTAYLKANYPVEFYCACISCETDPDAQSIYVNDTKRHGIDITPPDINKSDLDFTIEGTKILYGFKGIKGIGDKAIAQIIEHRPYSSAMGFLRTVVDQKLRIPKQVFEALIKIGAFDGFGVNRRLMLDTYDKVIVDYKGYCKTAKPTDVMPGKYVDDSILFQGGEGQLTLFDILTNEKKYMGIYITGNPFDFAKDIIGDTSSYRDAVGESTASVFCEIMSIKETKTKAKGEKMGIYKCIDSHNEIFEFPIFPDLYKKYSDLLEEGNFIVVNFSNSKRGMICLSVKNVNSLIDEYTKTQRSDNAINSIALRVSSLSDLKKVLTRKQKETEEDIPFLRPCHMFFSLGSYTFILGEISFSSSNNSIRLLNQIEGIDIKINR